MISNGKEAIPALTLALLQRPAEPVFEAAVWTLAQIPGGIAPLRALLHKEITPDGTALVARALGRTGDQGFEDGASRAAPRPCAAGPTGRRRGARALRCPDSVPQILEALGHVTDRFLEHSLVNVLYRFASTDDLLRALEGTAPQVQRAALVLLDQAPRDALPAETAVTRLFASDASLRRAARAALLKHQDWIGQALPALRRVAADAKADAPDLAMLNECVLAFYSHPEPAGLSLRLSRGLGSSLKARVLLLESIARVPARQMPRSWVQPITALARSGPRELQLQAVRTARSLQLTELDEVLAHLASDEAQTPEIRIESLGALVRRRPQLGASELEFVDSALPQTRPASDWARRKSPASLSSRLPNSFDLCRSRARTR